MTKYDATLLLYFLILAALILREIVRWACVKREPRGFEITTTESQPPEASSR